MAKKLDIALVRSPQPYLITDGGELFSPNRFLAPEPTLPLLHGILQKAGVKSGLEVDVTQLDLRDSKNGEIVHNHYGDVRLSYIKNILRKVCSGVSIDSQMEKFDKADVIGFTNNFTMSRNVVRENIRKVREAFPDKEIWVGGRDVFPEHIVDLYTGAAGNKNVVAFNGHVFSSLPKYLQFKSNGKADLHGITIFDKDGRRKQFQDIPFGEMVKKGLFDVPVPIYPDEKVLDKFNASGEGPIESGHGRFAHMTIGIGCPHECGYCTTGWRERGLVSRDVDSVEKELDYYKSMGVETLAIMDDNLLSMGPRKVNEIMGLVNSRGFNVEYGNGLELKLLHKQWDVLHKSVLGNCNVLYAPLEDLTGDVSYQKLEQTDKQLELMKNVVNFFDAGAKDRPRYITMGVIVGVPGHTYKGLYETLPRNAERFLELFVDKKVGTAITAFNFMPLAGTSFGNEALRSGRMVTDVVRENPEAVTFELATYAPEGLTHEQVFEAYNNVINLNPAGRLNPEGERLGTSYENLKRFGERALPKEQMGKIPSCWSAVGKEFTGGRVAGAGMHYKAPMTSEISKENRLNITKA